MDNSTSDSSDFDLTLLQEDFDISDLSDWGVDVKLKEDNIEPEIEFTEELLEEHNYVVLYFDNSVDWLQAETIFGEFIKKNKQALSSKENYKKIGVGRVVNGTEFLNKIVGV